MQDLVIGDRVVGPNHPPLVIPEVGINHEGSIAKAIQCVDAAVESGAECIKFQSHIVGAEMLHTDMKPGKISDESLWDIIKRCQLTEAEERAVMEHCASKGILYLSTPFSREAADRLDSFGVPAFKIGSGECSNYPLIDHIARKHKPVLLSTGMNSIASIRKSVEILRRNGCPFMLFHCTSMYPTPYGMVRLGAIPELIEEFDAVVGLSDHSLGIYTCLGAVAVGARVLEKHFTVTRSWPGPDVPISIEPAELRDLVTGSRAVYEALGGHKGILPEEKPVIDFAYASVVSIRPIAKGDVLSADNLWVKRPGTGKIPAEMLHTLFGKRATRSIPADTQIEPADVH
jgi:sialic acid synthase SpsE